MSYYRPSSLMKAPATSNQLDADNGNATASSSRLPPIEEAGVVIRRAKNAGKGKTAILGMRRPTNMLESELWAAKMCTVVPFGSCQRVQTQDSMFCTYHACQAINADGERCGNRVANPRETRICSSGWHMENSRHSHLSDLLARRRYLETVDCAARESQRAEQLSYFEHHFPNADISPPASMRSSSSSDGHVQHASPGDKGEQAWGAHGVDRWWEGRWGSFPIEGASAGLSAEVEMAELPFVRKGS